MPSVSPTARRPRRGSGTVRRDSVSLPPIIDERAVQRLWPHITEFRTAGHRYRINDREPATLRWVDSASCWIAKSVRDVNVTVDLYSASV